MSQLLRQIWKRGLNQYLLIVDFVNLEKKTTHASLSMHELHVHPSMLGFVLGMLEWEQLLILGIEPRILHLLGKCSNMESLLAFYFVRRGLTRLSREASDLCPPTSSS